VVLCINPSSNYFQSAEGHRVSSSLLTTNVLQEKYCLEPCIGSTVSNPVVILLCTVRFRKLTVKGNTRFLSPSERCCWMESPITRIAANSPIMSVNCMYRKPLECYFRTLFALGQGSSRVRMSYMESTLERFVANITKASHFLFPTFKDRICLTWKVPPPSYHSSSERHRDSVVLHISVPSFRNSNQPTAWLHLA
jgi:hypothetical protein